MKTLKILLITFFVIIFLFIIVLPAIFLIFGIQSKPLVTAGKQLSYEDVARVKQLMRENDPRKLKPGEIRNTTIAERDLNLFLDYASTQASTNQKIYAHVNFYQDLLNVQVSYAIPKNPLGNYLNVSADLIPEPNRLSTRRLEIGALGIPGWLINFVMGLAHKLLWRFEDYQNVMALAESIKDIQIVENSASVAYQWQPELIQKIRIQGRDFLVPADDRERLRAYGEQLARLSQTMKGRVVSVSFFLQPLFQFAEQRTMVNGNPQAENRALILNLAAFSVGRNINKFIDTENSSSYPSFSTVKLTLSGRNDLAKHFLVSAAITVSAGSALANFAGIFKEMDDSRGGSGFSFADLAADRAGVKFAEMASGSSQQAKLLQQRMIENLNETDFMPRIDNLPEGIQDLELKSRYKNLDSENYRIVEKEIERRIAACRLYQ